MCLSSRVFASLAASVSLFTAWGRSASVLTLGFPVTPVSGIGMIVALAHSPPGGELFAGSITIWFSFFGVLTCVANVYSIVMISWKALSVTFHHRLQKYSAYPCVSVQGQRACHEGNEGHYLGWTVLQRVAPHRGIGGAVLHRVGTYSPSLLAPPERGTNIPQ